MSGIPALLALLAGISIFTGPVRAESLIISLSSPHVAITSTYIGTDLVIFGVIGRDQASATRSEHYDIVVSARGPRPFWVNQHDQKFTFVPVTMAVASNRPLDEITSPDMQSRYQLGLNSAIITKDRRDDHFAQALIRIKERDKLYDYLPHHVEFITPNVFKAVIPVPARAPIGLYDVEVALLSDSVRLASQSTHFEVIKIGFEQDVAEAARLHGWLYGFAALLMAGLFGWLATIIFRRD